MLKSTGRIRSTTLHLLDHEYIVGHIAPDGIWGVTAVWRHDHRVQFADPARTVVDVLDQPHLAGGIRGVGDFLVRYLEEHDPKTLIPYADQIGSGAIFKRLGYLLVPDARRPSRFLTVPRASWGSGNGKRLG